MRTVEVLKSARFWKEGTCQTVTLPHTWNALDGQDGGNDYYRGTCTYEMPLPSPTTQKRQFIQFEGANHAATVYCNEKLVGTHEGGFSTFRFELSGYMREADNVLRVEVDNDAPDVYPQQADFTFFGGLYRDVSFVEVETAHISLEKDGTDGLFVTWQADGTTRVDAFVEDARGCEAVLRLKCKSSGEVVLEEVKEVSSDGPWQICFMEKLENPHKWDGTKNAFLYEAELVLRKDGATLDEVTVTYGYREFYVDAQTGFYLNGSSYPLHGVSRHQDRQDMGWAIGDKEHREDMQIIREMGANSIRLAHYQHSQTFYDLCDEEGMVVWAEIPFISNFLKSEAAKENTLSQMKELIAQNYNHPSICFWGISNEITIAGESEALVENQRELGELAKKMDPSRLTTMAHISIVKAESEQCALTDIMGYNIYCGWYTGLVEENGEMLDAIHQSMPDRPIALSEYGADALTKWHSAAPKNHDYTEEYQAHYHEVLLETFETRPYLWATYVWNMFDFAADARDEGGCKGRNNKGLVTYDRRLKKDAFYIYQAYWTGKPMVHICGRRFVNRGPKERDVKVYTNCGQVTLYVNKKAVETKRVKGHRCVFENVNLLDGENEIRTVTESGERDDIVLCAVSASDKSYVMPDDEIIAGNWYDEETGETMAMEYPEGYYSIKDTMADIMKNPQAAAVYRKLKEMMEEKRRQTAGDDNETKGLQNAGDKGANEQMMKSLNSIPLQQLMKLGGIKLEPGALIKLNREFNRIKK